MHRDPCPSLSYEAAEDLGTEMEVATLRRTVDSTFALLTGLGIRRHHRHRLAIPAEGFVPLRRKQRITTPQRPQRNDRRCRADYTGTPPWSKYSRCRADKHILSYGNSCKRTQQLLCQAATAEQGIQWARRYIDRSTVRRRIPALLPGPCRRSFFNLGLRLQTLR